MIIDIHLINYADPVRWALPKCIQLKIVCFNITNYSLFQDFYQESVKLANSQIWWNSISTNFKEL